MKEKFNEFTKKIQKEFESDVATVQTSLMNILENQEAHVFSKQFRIIITFYSNGMKLDSSKSTLLENSNRGYCQQVVSKAVEELLENEKVSLSTAANCEWALTFQPLI